MELQTLVDEYASIGLGEHLYQELLRTVRTVSWRYPVSYSPTGHWDEGAFTALAHDWAVAKLWRLGHLEHLLLTNQTLTGFRNGLAKPLGCGLWLPGKRYSPIRARTRSLSLLA